MKIPINEEVNSQDILYRKEQESFHIIKFNTFDKEKPQKMQISQKMSIFGTFWWFFLIFSVTVLGKDLWFFALRSVHQDASFVLSKSTLRKNQIFYHTGDPFDLGGGGKIS